MKHPFGRHKRTILVSNNERMVNCLLMRKKNPHYRYVNNFIFSDLLIYFIIFISLSHSSIYKILQLRAFLGGAYLFNKVYNIAKWIFFLMGYWFYFSPDTKPYIFFSIRPLLKSAWGNMLLHFLANYLLDFWFIVM